MEILIRVAIELIATLAIYLFLLLIRKHNVKGGIGSFLVTVPICIGRFLDAYLGYDEMTYFFADLLLAAILITGYFIIRKKIKEKRQKEEDTEGEKVEEKAGE